MSLNPEEGELTARESQLLEFLIGSGEDTANIAYRMGLTFHTAKVYSSRIYRKLGVGSRIELMSREIERLKSIQGDRR